MSLARGSALGLLLGLAASVAAQELTIPPPGTAGWQPLAFPKIERHTRYTTASEDGRGVLRAESECSASGLLHPLRSVDLAKTPLLRWRWRLDEGLAAADERSKDGDDFAARVYVTFAFEPERASLLERAARRLGAAVYGEDMPGSSLTYVWSSGEPVGARWPNPFTASARMIVAASGASSEWRSAEVDLLADYQRSFGHPAPAPFFLALMTDTDNRCLRARASYADFRFAPRSRTKSSTPSHTDSKRARSKPLPVVSQSKCGGSVLASSKCPITSR
jgi:hypothetical protein